MHTHWEAPQRPRTLQTLCRGTSLIRKRPPPVNHHRFLGTGLLEVPRGGRFLMSEVLLYSTFCMAKPVEYRGSSK